MTGTPPAKPAANTQNEVPESVTPDSDDDKDGSPVWTITNVQIDAPLPGHPLGEHLARKWGAL